MSVQWDKCCRFIPGAYELPSMGSWVGLQYRTCVSSHERGIKFNSKAVAYPHSIHAMVVPLGVP